MNSVYQPLFPHPRTTASGLLVVRYSIHMTTDCFINKANPKKYTYKNEVYSLGVALFVKKCCHVFTTYSISSLLINHSDWFLCGGGEKIAW